MRAAILLGFFACFSLGFAQTVTQVTTPDGKIHTRIEGIDIPNVPSAPFTAKVSVTWDEPLVGGGAVSRRYYTMVARDSQGRVRREMRGFVPADSADEPPLHSFTVRDPVAGTRTVCHPDTMKCTVTEFHARAASTEVASGPLPDGSGTVSTESLGQRTQESLTVVGTRETTTTIAGTHGNDRQLVSSKERWYSPDLQICLSVIRNDPQFGTQTLTVTALERGEPDPSWFAVPEGYKVMDLRGNNSPSN